MLFDPTRHEPLGSTAWDENAVRAAITRIVADTESRYSSDIYWPIHPHDNSAPQDPPPIATSLYYGACGVIWGLNYLQSAGAVRLSCESCNDLNLLLERNRTWLGDQATVERASFLMGDTPIQLMAFGKTPTPELESILRDLIANNQDHPARELMWGSPGTLLAALFLFEKTGQAQWAYLFKQTAATLWSQLKWSTEVQCAYWTQDLYGRESAYLDAVHGFVATALPLISGRHLLEPEVWTAWQQCINNTISKTATWQGSQANWYPILNPAPESIKPMLMQFCHGAPGFIICLANMPGPELDDLLIAGGEAIWAAGPLTKGSNLCHGTGGNGYAFLKLYQRTQNPIWLARARAFAMHGIEQTEKDAKAHGQMRYSLWTGDIGFAIYLWDCIRAKADFPSLDIYFEPGVSF